MTKFETEIKMAVKNCELAPRTWRVLRVALLFNRRIIKEIRRTVKSMGSEKQKRSRHQIGERQLSFDKSPVFHVKMYRPASNSMRLLFPCVNPVPECDCVFDGGEWEGYNLGDDEIDSSILPVSST